MRSFFVFAARGMLLNKLSFAGTEELLHRFTRFVLTVLFLNAFAGCGDLTHRCPPQTVRGAAPHGCFSPLRYCAVCPCSENESSLSEKSGEGALPHILYK